MSSPSASSTQPGRSYHLVGSSVTEPDWLAQVPSNRPAVVVRKG